MKNLKKKLSKLLCLVAVMGCFMGAQSTNVKAYTIVEPGTQDINEDVFEFDEILEGSDNYRVYVTPYISGSDANLYIRFYNWDRADLMLDVFDMEDRDTVYKEITEEKKITAYVTDLNPSHRYRITIRNRSDFSTNVYGSIF